MHGCELDVSFLSLRVQSDYHCTSFLDSFPQQSQELTSKWVNMFISAKDQLVPLFGLSVEKIRELVYLGVLR